MTRRKTPSLPPPQNRATKLALLQLALVEFEIQYTGSDEQDIQRCLTQAGDKMREARNKIRRVDAGEKPMPKSLISDGSLEISAPRLENAIAEVGGTINPEAVRMADALKSEIVSDVDDGTAQKPSAKATITYGDPGKLRKAFAEEEEDRKRRKWNEHHNTPYPGDRYNPPLKTEDIPAMGYDEMDNPIDPVAEAQQEFNRVSPVVIPDPYMYHTHDTLSKVMPDRSTGSEDWPADEPTYRPEAAP